MRCSLSVLFLTLRVGASGNTTVHGANDEAVGGVKLALTQHLLDYIVGVAKPSALEFFEQFQFPDPVVKGDDYSISWSVGGVKLGGGMDADFALDLVEPSSLRIEISNLRLSVSASLRATEDIWPHPSLDIGIGGDADGSSASATLSVATDGYGVPSLSLDTCTPTIQVNNVHVTGGLIWPFDQLADLVINSYKDDLVSQLGPMICDTGIRDELLRTIVNPSLRAWTYTIPLPLPAPYDQAVLDYHLTATPVVASAGYLEAAASSRVDVAGVKSLLPIPVMPTLTAAQLGARMLTAQLSPYVLNTALDGFQKHGLIRTSLTPSMLPDALRGVLNTDFFSLLLPRLAEAYPHGDLILNLSATAVPVVSFARKGATVKVDAEAAFFVAPSATKGSALSAFSMLCPSLETTVVIRATSGPAPALTAEVGGVNVRLQAGKSSFGTLGPEVIALLSEPLNQILNSVVIPLANRIIAPGIPIPQVDETVGGYRFQLAVTQPEITKEDGFGLIATDISASITPAAVSAAATAR